MALARPGAGRRFFQDRLRLDARDREGRDEPEHEPRDEREHHGEGERAHVHRHWDGHRSRLFDETPGQLGHHEARQKGSQSCADQEHDDRLRHNLRGEPRGRRSERSARGHLAPSCARAGQKEIPDVRAHDQEDQPHRGEEHPNPGSRRANEAVVKIFDADADARVRVGIGHFEGFGDGLELRFGLRERHPWFPSTHHLKEVAPAPRDRLRGIPDVRRRERGPQIGAIAERRREAEADRSHADEDVWDAVQRHRRPDRSRIPRKSSLKEPLGDDDGLRRVDAIVFVPEEPPVEWR